MKQLSMCQIQHSNIKCSGEGAGVRLTQCLQTASFAMQSPHLAWHKNHALLTADAEGHYSQQMLTVSPVESVACDLQLQVDVMFEEVDEIVVQESDLPFIAGRLAEPVQPNLLRMRALLSASKHNIVLVDGVENASIISPLLFLFMLKHFVCYESDIIVMELH